MILAIGRPGNLRAEEILLLSLEVTKKREKHAEGERKRWGRSFLVGGVRETNKNLTSMESQKAKISVFLISLVRKMCPAKKKKNVIGKEKGVFPHVGDNWIPRGRCS